MTVFVLIYLCKRPCRVDILDGLCYLLSPTFNCFYVYNYPTHFYFSCLSVSMDDFFALNLQQALDLVLNFNNEDRTTYSYWYDISSLTTPNHR
jgi:hypothetical protein